MRGLQLGFDAVKTNGEIMGFDRFNVRFDQMHEMTGFFGGQAAVVHRGCEGSRGCDDILRLFDRWQLEVDRPTVTAWSQPFKTVMKAAHIALQG